MQASCLIDSFDVPYNGLRFTFMISYLFRLCADIYKKDYLSEGGAGMGEMMIRRIGGLPAARYQEVSRSEKTPGGTESQSVKKSTGLNVSETLR